jgi:hypothetical protein
MNLWTAGAGLMVKSNNFVLANYKQYKKLIRELATEDQLTDPPRSHHYSNVRAILARQCSSLFPAPGLMFALPKTRAGVALRWRLRLTPK